MVGTRLIRVAAVCAVATATALLVAGPASAEAPPWHEFVAAALAIPSRPGTHAHASTTRFQTAHGPRAKVDGVATASLNCDRCSAHAFNMQVTYAWSPHAVVADNVATAWASRCAQCSGWALSLQIVVAKSARAVTAANRSLALTTACRHCAVKAAAMQIVVITASERHLTRRQADGIRALCDKLATALTRAAITARTRPTPHPARDRSAQAITAATKQIQAIVATGLHARAVRHAVGVRG